MSKRPKLFIIRGLPGSGKTTKALHYFPHLMRVETDMYFSRNDKYIFTKELNERAVKWFHKSVREFAKTGMDFVVTGVFAAHTERLAKTVKAGLDYGYDVFIETLTADFGNIHKVPKAHLQSMREAFVSEGELRKIYKGNRRVHFGLI